MASLSLPIVNTLASRPDAEALFALHDALGLGVLVLGPDGYRSNGAARLILGLPEGETTPDRVQLRRLDGSRLPNDELPSREARRNGEPVHARLRFARPDGDRLVECWASPPLPPDGRDQVLLIRDVTEDIDRLVVAESFLEPLFETLPIALVVTDVTEGVVKGANRSFLALSGFEAAETLGHAPPHPWWPDGVPGVGAGAWDADADATESMIRRKDGALVPVEIRNAQIAYPSRQETLVVTIVNDLTERRRFEQQLLQSGKLATIGELAAGVAHEINNPLFAILGLTEFLLNEVDAGSRTHERLQLIQQTGLEMREIVRALLDFARERSDEIEPVALASLAAQTVELVRRTTPTGHVELIERYTERDALVRASANGVKQIVLNLVTNALQALRQSGGTVTVEVGRSDGDALLSVADSGVGIPPELLARIFDPFFTTKRELGGTGLGLSVSHGIAQMYGGSLTVESRAGAGAKFTLRLPLLQEGGA